MARLEELSAEELIAALIHSNGGELILRKVSLEINYKGTAIQITERTDTGDITFRIIDEKDVEIGSEALSDGDSSHSDLS